MDYFPLALALGKAFCNRVDETKHLISNIDNSRPTLIASPRRYGKTSLAIHSIRKIKLSYVKFDFLSAVDEEDIEKIVLKGVGYLLGEVEKAPRKLLKLATDFFSGLNIKLGSDKLGISVELSQRKEKPAYNILNVIERLDKLCNKRNKKLILFFDEFQRVYQICKDQSIESVLRQVSQESKNLVFIYSGSNRHLLESIFNDRNRPFYRLCDKITLDRIPKQDYVKYFQSAAHATWGKQIDSKTVEDILFVTERHPYYVNQLCSRLYKLEWKKTTTVVVSKIWQAYISEERSQVAEELDLISKNQRKLLTALAKYGGTNAPRGHKFQQLSRMSSTTIAQSLDFLTKRDYVYRTEEGVIKVLDPLIKYVLANNYFQ